MSTPANRDSFLSKLKGASEVTITVIGRRTRIPSSTPVWFVLDESRVLLVPMHGSESQWFKDLVKDSQIELTIGGTAVQSRAKLVSDRRGVEPVLDGFRAKYTSMWSESYYDGRDVYVQVPI